MPNTVLIVEDDRAIRGLIKVVLERDGFSTEVAASGKQALQLITTNKYEAVILDLMMPEISGLDILSRLMDEQPETRCVVLISAGSEAMLDAIDVQIVRAKLRKPFEIDDLVAAVRSCREDKESAQTTKNYPQRRRGPEGH